VLKIEMEKDSKNAEQKNQDQMKNIKEMCGNARILFRVALLYKLCKYEVAIVIATSREH